VVSSYLGALPETAAGNLLTRQPYGSWRYVQELAEAAVLALTDQAALERIGARNRAFAAQNTWDHVAARIVAVVRRTARAGL